MPEGHLLHRYADQVHADLAGRTVSAGSPQGRFDAAPVDGRTVTAAEAHGKHLLVHLDGAPAVHVHLGLRGVLLRHDDPSVPPRGGVRLRLAAADVAWDLIAPTTCELLDDTAPLLARLGPDPLRGDADPDEAVRRLRAFRGPVGGALLDQGVWAGLGNAWRAELLFLEGLAPDRPAGAVGDPRALWERTCVLLALGRDAGQVVSDPDAPDERWVYKRPTCRSCGAAVRTAQLAGRTAHWCPEQQS
ncbi:MAG: formamidopyrimidine-DNA glycolase [Frankiales bacterium]|nr:formamidopyrimidine-DNA glycolase [Frankiales bacterium]